MKLNAKTVKQGKTTFYETSISALELVDEKLFKVDRWNPTGGSGYQRELNLNHIRNIARYLQGEEGTNVLPTAVILNSRKPLKVTPYSLTADSDSGLVQIEIDDRDFPLWITDGQHRIKAIELASNNGADLDNYNVNVTITNFSLEEEIQHFRKINTSANKAPKGLDQQLKSRLATMPGYDMDKEDVAETRAVAIVTRLATDPESPWYGRVALGGQRKKLEHTTAQSPMVISIKTMFSRGRFSDAEANMNEVYQVFFDFWKAVEENFPEAFATPTKYNIQRSVGIRAWHDVLNRIFGVQLSPTREQVSTAIASMRDAAQMDVRYWEIVRGPARLAVSNYGGTQGYLRVSDQIWYNMDKNLLKKEGVASVTS